MPITHGSNEVETKTVRDVLFDNGFNVRLSPKQAKAIAEAHLGWSAYQTKVGYLPRSIGGDILFPIAVVCFCIMLITSLLHSGLSLLWPNVLMTLEWYLLNIGVKYTSVAIIACCTAMYLLHDTVLDELRYNEVRSECNPLLTHSKDMLPKHLHELRRQLNAVESNGWGLSVRSWSWCGNGLWPSKRNECAHSLVAQYSGCYTSHFERASTPSEYVLAMWDENENNLIPT